MLYLLSFLFVISMLYYIIYVYQATNAPIPFALPYFPKVSIVIAARNEEANITNCLNAILQQNYPQDKYEIILVNDFSEDNTAKIAKYIAQKHTQLKVFSLSQNAGKKAAIAHAISQAKGEIILQTDADCVMQKDWIKTMMSFFTAKTALISGPVQLVSNDNQLFINLQIWEFMGLNLLGGGAMNQGKPNMCNGANLAFRKAVFEEVNGFEGIDKVASGDDELLLQKIDALKKYEIHYAFDKNAIVQTPVQETFSKFWQQRVRWVSKARAYQNRYINLTQILFFLAISGIPIVFLLVFYHKSFFFISLFLFVIKMLFDFPLMRKACHFFGQKFSFFIFIALEISYIPYVSSIGIVGNFVKNYTWKGRKVQ